MARRGPRTRSNSCPMNPEAPMTMKRMSEDMLSHEIEFEGYLSRAHYRSTYLKYHSLAFGKSVLRNCVESPSRTGFMANAAISDLPSPNVTLKPNCSKASRMPNALVKPCSPTPRMLCLSNSSRFVAEIVMARHKTREAQYQACVDEAEKLGVERLGMQQSQSWRDDPKHLVFNLSRYKFVAKMLSGSNHVLEIGCGDAFGSRIVRQEVCHL